MQIGDVHFALFLNCSFHFVLKKGSILGVGRFSANSLHFRGHSQRLSIRPLLLIITFHHNFDLIQIVETYGFVHGGARWVHFHVDLEIAVEFVDGQDNVLVHFGSPLLHLHLLQFSLHSLRLFPLFSKFDLLLLKSFFKHLFHGVVRS